MFCRTITAFYFLFHVHDVGINHMAGCITAQTRHTSQKLLTRVKPSRSQDDHSDVVRPKPNLHALANSSRCQWSPPYLVRSALEIGKLSKNENVIVSMKIQTYIPYIIVIQSNMPILYIIWIHLKIFCLYWDHSLVHMWCSWIIYIIICVYTRKYVLFYFFRHCMYIFSPEITELKYFNLKFLF